MKKNNLMSGAFVLSVGSVLAKIFSSFYRIVLTKILGGVGIGLYQLIFPFYSLCVVLATAGLPMAISKVISKHGNNETGVMKKCFLFTSVVAFVLVGILTFFARGLAELQGQTKLTICYIILAPTILLVSATSVLRGYFQGKHNFTPSAISNISEQFVKMVIGLILSLCLVNISLIAGIIGAIVGIVASEVVSLLILLIYIKKEKLKWNSKANVSVKELVKDILPITLTNIILPISTFIDSVLVVNLLSKNFSGNISVFLYGIESGAVSSLVSIPTIFSFAIASVILPNITRLKSAYNRNYKLSLAIKLVCVITIPCVLCFLLVPNKLIELIYQNNLDAYGINSVSVGAKLLSISGIGVVFLALNQVYSCALQAVDQRYVAIRNLTIAVVVKFIFELILIPSKIFNIYALALANTICYVLVMVLNQLEIKDIFRIKLGYDFWAKLILSNCVLIIGLFAVMAVGISVINTLLAVLIAGCLYLYALYVTSIFTTKDKAMLKYKV